MEFDFEGINDEVKTNESIKYTLADGRNVTVVFESKGVETKVTETFDAEDTNSVELQGSGWQAVMDNFKKYSEEK